MGGASSYLAILSIAAFLAAAWTATKLSKMAGVSSIVLEIATGVVLGPNLLGLISEEYAECDNQRHTKCTMNSSWTTDADVWQAKVEGKLPLSIGRIAGMGLCNFHEHKLEHDHENHGDHDNGNGTDTDGDEVSTTKEDEVETTKPPETTTKALTTKPPETTTTKKITTTKAPTTVPPETTAKPLPTTQKPTTTQNTNSFGIETQEDDEVLAATPDPGAGHDDPEEVATATQVVSSDNKGNRRLSASGGKDSGKDYDDYRECLEKNCEADIAHECGLAPDVFTLIGHAGVALMIFESGMHFDFEKAKIVGPKACLVAVLGTFMPLLTGMLLMMIYGYPASPDAISVGTALAPTSVGIALRLLSEAGVLQHDFGQAIITAAFVDDILSLVLFNVLFSMRGDFDVFATVISPIIGIVFMAIAMVLAVIFWPRFINEFVLPKLQSRRENVKISGQDEALFFIMLTVLIAYATITHFLGTHLWGCFIAGMSFACIDKPDQHGHTHHVWVRQTKRLTSWMIRIFFACTVAFSIPISKLLSFEAFLKGSAMGIGPCILTKVLCAPFMGKERFVIGWAMVGRAEFAYLIAQMAAAANMIDADAFSICIWALLYATIFAPFIFRTVLNRYIASENIETDDKPDVEFSDVDEEDEDSLYEYNQPQKTSKEVRDVDVEDPKFDPNVGDLHNLKLANTGNSNDDSLADDFGKVAESKEASGGFRPWWGKKSTPSVSESSNGFLCCLLFKKVLVKET